MMSAILKIKPQIDQNDAKKMERSLFDRFKNIGKQAKKTLRDVVSGGLLGFAVGLAQSMLSPIEEVETRIKAMLDKAGELADIAEDFNTSTGKLRQLEVLGLVNGLKSENLKAMLTAFRDSVELARAQIEKKEPLDEKTSLVQNFAGRTDMAEAFFEFIQSLRQIQGAQRNNIERTLFGNVQRGGARRFIDNAGVVHGPQGYVNPRVGEFTKAATKLEDLNDKYTMDKFSQESREILNYSANLNKGLLDQMIGYENRQKAKELRQLQNYTELAAARLAIDKLNGILENVTGLLTKLVGYLGQFLTYLQNSPLTKGFMKVIGVK